MLLILSVSLGGNSSKSCLRTAQAMMASPHAFKVEQWNETIDLKIKGDEKVNWVTDMNGKSCLEILLFS